MTQMRTEIVETRRGPVECTQSGSGDPVLYFHGTGVTGEAMMPIESPIVEDGFRLIIPNRAGYGRTPLSPNNSAAAFADVAAALLDALELASVSAMGSSGGAAFAASFAIHHSGRAKSLVLMCPQLHRWDQRRWLPATSRWTLPLLQRPMLRKILCKLYRGQLSRMTVDQYLKMEVGDRYEEVARDPAARTLGASGLAAVREMASSPGFENDISVFSDEEIVGSNASLDLPTLIIHDERDPVAPVDHVDWLVSRFPHCERLAIHAAGHLVWVGPEANLMHESRVRFLRQHRAGGTAKADG